MSFGSRTFLCLKISHEVGSWTSPPSIREHERWNYDANIAIALILFAFDGGHGVVLKFYDLFFFFNLRDAHELAEHLPGGGIANHRKVFLFVVNHVFPAGGVAFIGFSRFLFGGLAERLRHFGAEHSNRDLFLGNQIVNEDLPLVEFFDFFRKIGAGHGEGLRANPADNPVAGGAFATHAVGALGDGFDFHLLIFREKADAIRAFFIGKNREFLRNGKNERFFKNVLEIDDVGVVIEPREVVLWGGFDDDAARGSDALRVSGGEGKEEQRREGFHA